MACSCLRLLGHVNLFHFTLLISLLLIANIKQIVCIDILQHLPITMLSPYPYLASTKGRERAMASTVSGNSSTPFFGSC
ncbi:hypothetical protein J3F84DRAFT_358560 [Trichoderma pleuroticola]